MSRFELSVAFNWFITKSYHPSHQSKLVIRSIATLLGKEKLQKKITCLVQECMHAYVYFDFSIQSNSDYIFLIYYNSSPSFLYYIYFTSLKFWKKRREKKKNYSTDSKLLSSINIYIYIRFVEGWSIMKWVWSPWNSSQRNSITWVYNIFAGSLWSSCREMPWEVDCLLVFFTDTFVDVAASWLLADCKHDHQDYEWKPEMQHSHDSPAEAREQILLIPKAERKQLIIECALECRRGLHSSNIGSGNLWWR